MGSVPSMNGKARETTLLMRDMRLGGGHVWPVDKETYAPSFPLQQKLE